ncbi:hypothetical protein CFB49_28835 [Burkholderia sp. AU17457]|nr:hypothetical protein CFB49_28835 [Burkholderia sp. AU17457]
MMDGLRQMAETVSAACVLRAAALDRERIFAATCATGITQVAPAWRRRGGKAGRQAAARAQTGFRSA